MSVDRLSEVRSGLFDAVLLLGFNTHLDNGLAGVVVEDDHEDVARQLVDSILDAIS